MMMTEPKMLPLNEYGDLFAIVDSDTVRLVREDRAILCRLSRDEAMRLTEIVFPRLCNLPPGDPSLGGKLNIDPAA